MKEKEARTEAEGANQTKDEFIASANKVHAGIYDYSKVDYINKEIKVIIICRKHGEFLQATHTHVRNQSGCPKCASSKGEKGIVNVLDELGLKHKCQARFKTCRHKKQLPFDFLVKVGERGFLLEFNGYHHYHPVRRNINMSKHDAECVLEQVKLRDNIKEHWCKEHNIPFLVIPYYEFNNIKGIISEFATGVSCGN